MPFKAKYAPDDPCRPRPRWSKNPANFCLNPGPCACINIKPKYRMTCKWYKRNPTRLIEQANEKRAHDIYMARVRSENERFGDKGNKCDWDNPDDVKFYKAMKSRELREKRRNEKGLPRYHVSKAAWKSAEARKLYKNLYAKAKCRGFPEPPVPDTQDSTALEIYNLQYWWYEKAKRKALQAAVIG